MNLTNALKTLRKELSLRDEPLKAYELLKEFDLPELKEDTAKAYELVRHAFDDATYQKLYGANGEDDVLDCELIEPRTMITNARGKYARYDWIMDELNSEKPNTFMDMACYIGSMVTSAGYMGIKSYGVDMTQKSIEVARERAKSAGIANVEFFRADATKFTDKKADLVTAFEVLEHVVDPVQFVKHLKSLANKYAYVSTPNLCYGDGDGNQGHWEWDGVVGHTRGHLRVFTKNSLKDVMDEAGAEVVYLEEMGDGLLWCKFKGGANGVL